MEKGCYYTSKARKSESNSQHAPVHIWTNIGCYYTSKARKSESNSQRKILLASVCYCCYCTSKARKSESNSQPRTRVELYAVRCYCTSKARKSESNSQRGPQHFAHYRVVIALAKLEKFDSFAMPKRPISKKFHYPCLSTIMSIYLCCLF